MLRIFFTIAIVNGWFWGKKEKVKLVKLKTEDCKNKTRNGELVLN